MYYLQDLNPVQREAVESGEGPLLILAGAGSGKTRVLTYRIARLIAGGVAPWHILAITFTNKAAQEMRDRITALVGSEGEGLWISTFHSACVRILRKEISKLPGYGRSFVIYDAADQLALVKDCLKTLNLDEKKFAPRAVLAVISEAKNKLQDAASFEAGAGDYFQEKAAKVYQLYQRRLTANNALDFDDLIMLTVKIFRENPDVLSHYQEKFRYILVDEYQDTNHAQYVLSNLLAQRWRKLCVVGDDDQSVYAGGARTCGNILILKRIIRSQVLKLEQINRLLKRTLQAANEVFRNYCNRKINPFGRRITKEKVLFFIGMDMNTDESSLLRRKFRVLMDAEGRTYADFAVLYRTNAQSRVLERSYE
jgi:DNA helicase-2/ATP-dependent DNA helicase PcrA